MEKVSIRTALAKGAAAAISFMLSAPSFAEEPVLPPPYEGAYQPRGVDEVGLWQRFDEQEKALAASNQVIRDEQLNSYVKDLFCRTVGQARCGSVRIYILREPVFNASMAANGTMRIFSGLFLRVHNEAELAAVLGHEFGHFEARHTLNEFKKLRSGTDLLAWGAVLAGFGASRASFSSYQNLQLSVYGDLYRYNRNQEREADLLGLSYLNSSDLRPQSAGDVWANVMGEIERSAQVRGLKKPKFKAIAFTASHPPHGERQEYLSELAYSDFAERDDGADRYYEALEPWLPIFLEDQVKLNDFGGSEYVIERLADGGWTYWLWHSRAELYRTRGNQRDYVNAVEFYYNAISLNPDFAPSHRGLGLSLMKIGQRSDGEMALSRYLELSPDAKDAALIRMMIPKKEIEE
jgi:predicted Zn-dependent protease